MVELKEYIMAVKTVFTNEEIQHIFANYNLGDYINSKPISEGTVQTNYKVQTTRGFFVFRYYENRKKDSVLFETNLLNYLKKNNFPVHYLIKIVLGALWVSIISNHLLFINTLKEIILKSQMKNKEG